MVQIEGPVVSQFQRLFLDNWHSQNGPGLSGNNYFPRVAEAGTDLVMAVGSSSRDSYRAQYTMYLSAFKSATRSLYVTNSYFVPDHRVIESLTGAAGRGVDVRLILPSKSDHFLVLKAGKSTYGTLLASGVRIYELRGSLLHAKTAVIDGIWSTVGSTNIEPWSFRANDEINALVLGEGFGREMERLFEDDLKQSDEVTLDQWLGQSYLDRLLRFFAGLLFRWLTIIHGALS
jgi:cardiolipin synthase